MILIVYGYNELDRLKESVEKLKERIDINDIIIAADNGSTDGTCSWLLEQKDIDTVYFDDGVRTFSSMMNEIIKEYGIEDDIFFVQASCLAAEFSTSILKSILRNNRHVGIIAPMSNDSDKIYSWVKKEHTNFQDGLSEDKNDLVYCLGVENGTFLVRKEVFQKNGLFDENLLTIENAVLDYVIRSISEGYVAAHYKKAYFYNVEENKRKDPYIEKYGIDLQYMRKKWNMQYFNKHANKNLISLIDEEENAEIRVLEVGCDCGATLIEIKNRFPKSKVFGLEINERAANIASKYCDVRVKNIEEMDLQFALNSFDYIIFGDVLEHLRDPEKIVNYCKTLLKEGGCILTSIPNLMNVSVIKDLINGNFTYTETGLLDKTHIHMFTYYEIVRMFSRCNYDIEEIRTVILPQFVDKEYVDKLMQLSSVKERALFETFQYVVKARAKENLLFEVSPIVTLKDKIYDIAEKPYKGV